MAVVRVIGKVDGVDLIFSRENSSSPWAAVVPLDLDGEYIVEVRAYDEAGNEAYATSMLFIVNPRTLRVEMLPLNYSTLEQAEDYIGERIVVYEYAYVEIKGPLSFEIRAFNFSYDEISSPFSFEILPHEYAAQAGEG